MDLILLIFGVPILLGLLCGWVQWFLVSHMKDRVVRLSVSLVLPLLTGFLTALCVYKINTVTGFDSLSWGLMYFPWSCGALTGTLFGWFYGWFARKEKKDE